MELEEACSIARECGVLSVDTEFVWMRTYAPQLGIVQIGADEDLMLVNRYTGAIPRNVFDTQIAAVREEAARKWNVPRNWLGDDGSLIAMGERGEVGRLQHRLRGGKADTMKAMYAAAIRSAGELPEEECPENPNPHYISEVLDAADAALEWLDGRCEELHVAPQLIANRATVTAFVDNVDDESNPLAAGWRYEAVGREMAEKFGVE